MIFSALHLISFSQNQELCGFGCSRKRRSVCSSERQFFFKLRDGSTPLKVASPPQKFASFEALLTLVSRWFSECNNYKPVEAPVEKGKKMNYSKTNKEAVVGALLTGTVPSYPTLRWRKNKDVLNEEGKYNSYICAAGSRSYGY